MSEHPPVTDTPTSTRSLVQIFCTALGVVLGGLLGFVVGVVGMWLLIRGSPAAIAGGGEGLQDLIAMAVCWGFVAALVGAALGGTVGYRASAI